MLSDIIISKKGSLIKNKKISRQLFLTTIIAVKCWQVIGDVKKIAKQLYKLGGRQLMVSSSDYLPSLYQSEISRAWDGIGGWLH